MTEEDVRKAVAESTSKEGTAKMLGYGYYNGRVGKTIDELIIKYNLCTSHFYARPSKYETVEKVCPQCSKVFTYQKCLKKDKECCSSQCANKYFGANRKGVNTTKSGKSWSEMMKQYFRDHPEKIRRGVGIYGGKERKPRPPAPQRDPSKPRLNRSETLKKYYVEHPEARERVSRQQKGKKKSPETVQKNRDAAMKAIAEGRHKGWQSRKIVSYPEKFFMGVLINNNIKYEHNLPAGKYFIDFAIEDKKIALEIDGRQHLIPERKASDEEKDKFLVSEGWSVYRIPWNQINNDDGKKMMKEKIDRFLETYKK